MSNILFEEYEKNIINKISNNFSSKQLKILNNFEINLLVALVFYREEEDIIILRELPNRDTVIVFQDEISIAAYDFCNVANDAYIVITKENIGVMREKNKNHIGKGVSKKIIKGRWTAMVDMVSESDGYSYEIFAHDENILRAAMMVYLKKFG